MRTHFLFTVAAALIPGLAGAQGSLIPRACDRRPCLIDGPCSPCGPTHATVVRQSSEVRADLVDRVLRYEITETFVNRGGRIGEADYILPLPKGAAFQDLKLSINGQLVSGEMMNAAQARGIYEEIVRRQRDPALVEWMGYGLVRARIFPIAPGEEKRVVVRYQMVAEREGDALRVDYFQGTQRTPNQPETLVRRGEETSRSSFVLSYPTAGQYGNAYSPTHSLTTGTRSGRREVTARGGGSEITVLIPVRSSSEPAISVLTYAPQRENGFALISLAPPMVAPRTTPRDVTLVLDVSGSMAGVKIGQARDAGKQLLATLRPEDRFRLIDFSTDVRSFRQEFVAATRENVAAGARYLENLDASGSTNISGALDVALEGRVSAGRLGLVLFVTDGAPTVGERDPEAISARVARFRGDRRIFSFGVGADLNVALIEQLAVDGRGTAQFVRPDESVERAVSIVASRLANPIVTNLRVSVDGVRLLKRHPSESADMFAGQDYILLARYSGSGSGVLRFQGETASGPVSWTSRASFPSASRDNAFIARLWATQRVGYLSAEKRKNGRSKEVDDEIRELGEKYSIPTEFTSYLVVEPGMSPQSMSGRVGGVARDASSLAPMAPMIAMAPMTAAAQAASKSTGAGAFEAARNSAAQRRVTNIAAAEESAAANGGEGTRRVGTRIFMLRGQTWTDAKATDSLKTVKVRSYSAAYFKLLEEVPELREVFALGDRVVVGGRSIAIEISPTGSESLSDADLKRIKGGW